MARESNSRITLFADSKTTMLCDWTDTVHDDALEPQAEVQVVHFFRAAQKTVIDRGGELIALSFVVCRQWPDEIKAFNAWINCRAETPRAGNLTWRERGSRGTLSRYMENCVVAVRPIRRLGVATYIHYVCTAPAISTTAPVQTT